MRKFFVTLMTSLLSCSAAFAFWPEAADSSFDLGVGYRGDKLKWKTEADTEIAGESVDLSSELEWRNLHIWQIEANFKYVTCDNIYFRAHGDYGWVTHGKVTDKDFISTHSDCTCDGESVEIADVHCKADRGHVYDVDLAIGYQFKMCDDSLAITPVLGYAWNGQHLELGGHGSSSSTCESTFSSPSTCDSSSSSLHSKYKARWNGPFLGVDFDYRLCDWTLFASYEFHWARYNARGDWNLRTDLPDGFHHHSKRAFGNVATLGVKWDFSECWTLGLVGRFQSWHAKKGTDKALISEVEVGDIETKCYVETPLRHVDWCSASVTVNAGMLF